ncbi:MAG: Gfo/Idh/MocA family oxidoreductase [Planctomycetes bacterium]|nr:Gfo/Idh/MocA family oxidoreductase [Planctomycetota bacterium]
MIDTARQTWPRPKRPRPIVFIGAGGIVRAAHLPAYRAQGLVAHGVFDVRPAAARALARDFAIPRIAKSLAHAAQLALEVEGVFDVAVPADQVLSVLGELPDRAVVLIQKPLGRDLAEARKIVALCRKKRLTAAVNFQLRFAPNMLVLQHQLARGRLGRPVDVEVHTRTHTPWSQWTFLRGIPRLEILYHSIHSIDLLRACFGEPRTVFADARPDPLFPGYADTRVAAVLGFQGGLRATIHTAHSHEFDPEGRSSTLLVEGTRAAARATLGVNLDYPRGRPDSLELCARRGRWKKVPLEGSWFPEAFAGTMCNLQRFAEGSDPLLHTEVGDALKTMTVVEACYRAAERGTTQALAPSPSDGNARNP